MTHRHYDLIANLMAITVVNLLEVIDVHHDQPELMPEAQSAGGFLDQPICEQSPIGQTGELIVQGVLFGLIFEQHELVLSPLSVSDVMAVKISDPIR